MNDQFFSIFTEEDVSYIPQIPCSFPIMPDIPSGIVGKEQGICGMYETSSSVNIEKNWSFTLDLINSEIVNF